MWVNDWLRWCENECKKGDGSHRKDGVGVERGMVWGFNYNMCCYSKVQFSSGGTSEKYDNGPSTSERKEI